MCYRPLNASLSRSRLWLSSMLGRLRSQQALLGLPTGRTEWWFSARSPQWEHSGTRKSVDQSNCPVYPRLHRLVSHLWKAVSARRANHRLAFPAWRRKPWLKERKCNFSWMMQPCASTSPEGQKATWPSRSWSNGAGAKKGWFMGKTQTPSKMSQVSQLRTVRTARL